MTNKKDAESGLEGVAINWAADVAEHDYAAAQAYLSLKLTAAPANKAVTRLRRVKLTSHRANDILRAAGLSAAPLDDPGVVREMIKVIEGKALSPIPDGQWRRWGGYCRRFSLRVAGLPCRPPRCDPHKARKRGPPARPQLIV
jgi:hypothetical protein